MPRLTDEHGNPRTVQGMATVIGHLFSAYAGVTFMVEGQRYRLRRKPEKGSSSHESPTYRFERVAHDEEGRRGGGGRDAADP